MSRIGAQGGAPPPGREEDLRAILTLLDEHRVVGVVAGRGMGRTILLETIADLYGVPCFRGRPPEEVEVGDLVVLDDAQNLGRRALGALLRRVVEADGRALIALYSVTQAPRRVKPYRLTTLGEEASWGLLEGRRGLRTAQASAVLLRCAGHPALLRRAGRWLGRARRDQKIEVLDKVLAGEVQGAYLEPLGSAAHREAALLAAAGGWLPDGLPLRGFTSGTGQLVEAGLAERVDGALVASPLLLVAHWPEPTEARRRTALAELRRRRVLDRSLVRLAEAHLFHGLGAPEEALEAAREAQRASRGKVASIVFQRAIERLALEADGALGACAGLASVALAFGRHHDIRRTRGEITALQKEGAFAPPEHREAETFLGFLLLEERKLEEAALALRQSAARAAKEGDAYGEAYALLWEVWARITGDELQAAEPLARRAASLARECSAPALEVRALHVQARIEALEGEIDSALRHLKPALKLARRHNLDDDQLIVLGTLAELSGRQGRPSEAADWLEAADAILARGHPTQRRGNLALTRAEIALRRGHVREAQRILASAAAGLSSMPWTKDQLEVEASLAAADYAGAAHLLATAVPHPGRSREWIRRRAAALGVLQREGLSPRIDLGEFEGDPLSVLMLHRARAELAEAGELLEELESRLPREDLSALPLLHAESIAVRLLQGRLREAAESVALLRDHFAAEAASTAAMLLLEGVVELIRGRPAEAARRALRAHRAGMQLGQLRMGLFALELLAVAHLTLGRDRGLGTVLGRARRLADGARSPARCARVAALRVARALRRGEEPATADLRKVEKGPDALARALCDGLLGREVDASLQPIVEALQGMVAASAPASVPWAPEHAGTAELELRVASREVKLAGGRTVSFARRRVLWRVLTELMEAGGEAVEPENLYTAAWQLPFNQSRLNSLYVGIRRLRLLVEPDPSAPRIILVGPTGGYYLDTARVELR
ncbi:MAG: winged helix-turn-helix domain-containing protein [Deltaproteobacteria bacterium]|nr:winged helix-turn-helix domain-containing protein [Deltaproteobacteria bacterium]